MREAIDLRALERRFIGCCLPEEEFLERIGRLREEQKRTQRRIEEIGFNPLAFESDDAHPIPIEGDDGCCPCKCCLGEAERHCWSREGNGYRIPGFYEERRGFDREDEPDEAPQRRDKEHLAVSITKKREIERVKSEKGEWRPKSTVPRPFFMTIRDESQEIEKRKKIDELRAEKEREEMLKVEDRKQLRFKARPVPQSTYYPTSTFPIKKCRLSYSSNRLYEDGTLGFPLRKCLSEGLSLWDQEPPAPEPFKARDVPLSTYTRPIEDEIRSQRRAAEKAERAIRLLKSSRPPTGIIDHATRSTVVHRIRHNAKCAEKLPKRARSTSIPDFAAIHEKWDRRMQSAKSRKPPTVVRPFHFVQKPEHEPHCKNDTPEKFARVPLRSAVSLGNLAEKVPIRANTTLLLRNEAIRRKVMESERVRNASKEFWRERALESHLMQQKLGKLTRAEAWRNTEQMAAEKRTSLAEQTEDYRREIEAMKSRVSRQPLVVERQMILMEKQRVDRMVKSALSEARESGVRPSLMPPLPLSRRASSASQGSRSSAGTQGTHVISKKETYLESDFESESSNYLKSSSSKSSKERSSSSDEETSESESSSEASSADLSRITEHTEHSD
ncbi:hypothetical protein QR680_005618 [Steinernema hermaphroditum]|uniref:Uncharacterized protein n=1 Tax=Steinernema hermaphroditum TaxID=289476 RepID=A0AA39HSR3_9BILA|nr:hypothetical protein QR680_005618 [Steinernema hermaphroditum]